jgi:hypothetical protein
VRFSYFCNAENGEASSMTPSYRMARVSLKEEHTYDYLTTKANKINSNNLKKKKIGY